LAPDSPADGRVEAARRALDSAFDLADKVSRASASAAVGVCGHGVPETLISASGATVIHVNFGRPPAETPMDDFIEPFVDAEVRIFLNRFATGAFDHLRGIVFARDDAPALVAYQYASEWVRQGRATGIPPRLFLFNLVHASSDAAAEFNRVQLAKLQAFLGDIGLAGPTGQSIARATTLAARRHALLAKATARARPSAAFRWRNAGRFLALEQHVDLLETALEGLEGAAPKSCRLALVGSPVASPAFFDMLASHGDLVCDLQGFGHLWPGAWEVEADRDDLLAAIANDAFCLRISPPQRHRAALVEAITSSACNLVICQLAQTDDTFGWEIPRLRHELADRGIRFVDLGFRDPFPDTAWLSDASGKVAAALESTL
jgi:hypothetical protein